MAVIICSDDIFKCIFINRIMLYFNSNFTDMCSHGLNSQYGIIGSDNGLAPNKRQAIMSHNDDIV